MYIPDPNHDKAVEMALVFWLAWSIATKRR